jgi:hypothetical protein
MDIESKGIHFRGRTFCSDECCEEFDVRLVDKEDPDLDDLDDFDPDDLGEELGYRDGDEDDDDLLDEDDDFKIELDDF